MADHNIRIVLEAVTKGGSNLRNFFANNEKDLQRLQTSARAAKKDLNSIFTSGGIVERDPITGRFIGIRKEVDQTTNSLNKFRRAFRQAVTGSAVGQAVGGFRGGLGEEARIREEVAKRLILSEREKQAKLDEIDKTANDNKLRRINDLEQAQVGEIRKAIAAEEGRSASVVRDLRSEGRIIQNQINLHEKLISEKQLLTKEERKEAAESLKDLRLERDAVDALIRQRIVERQSFVDSEKRKIAAEHTIVRDEENRTRQTARGGVLRPSRTAITQDVREEFRNLDRDIDKSENRIRRFGASSGRAFGQFRSGLRIARSGLSDVEKDLLKTSSAAERFGAHLGNAVRPAGAFRTRVILLISALQIFGTLIVQAGAALVALASSAILAGAALGGALLAGVTQLLPVVGLLAAAFHRLGAVLDAAKLEDKLKLSAADDQKTKLDSIRAATQKLTDSRYSLAKAAEAVKDSEYDLVQAGIAVKDAIKDQQRAIKDLADARKQAARDIVDANFEEKDAALSLRDAELAVVDAKKKLREEDQKAQLGDQNIQDAQAQVKEAQARLVQARQEGDTAEISVALQQLSVAEQDLQQIQAGVDTTKNDAKQAKLDVAQAQLAQQQAVVRNKRAHEDAVKARKEGVEGSDRVVSAEKNLVDTTRAIATAQRQQVLASRALRDAIHGLVIAKREERDAETGLTDARSKATSQQKQLQDAIGDLSPAERKLKGSIQRIKKIYADNFRPITDIIISSFSRAIDTVAPLLQDPQILNGAKKLATAIGASVDKIAHFVVSPEFKKFLTFTLGEATKNVPKLTTGFIDLAKVLIRVARAAAPIFDKLLDRFVKFLDRLEQRTRDPKGINNFFATASRHLDSWIKFGEAVGRILGLVIKFSAQSGKGILDDLTNKLNEWSDWLSTHGEEVRVFFHNVRIQIGALAEALGKMAVILFKAFSSDSASQLSILILNTIIPAFALFLKMLGAISTVLNAVFKIPVVGPLTQDVVEFGIALLIATKFVATILVPVRRLTDAFKALQIILTKQAFGTRLGLLYLNLKKALNAATIAQIRFNIAAASNVYILAAIAIAALIVALVLLERKYHFIEAGINSVADTFRKVADFFTTHWKTVVLAAILAPFSPFLAGGVFLVRFRDNILGTARAVINFFKTNWGNVLTGIILGPFQLAKILVIKRFGDDIVRIIRGVVTTLIGYFHNLPENIARDFTRIPEIFTELARDAYNFGRDLIQGIIDGIKSKAFDLKDTIKNAVLGAVDFVKDALGIGSPSRWTHDNVGVPIADGIRDGATEGLRGLGNDLSTQLRGELFNLEGEARNIKNRILNSLSGLQGAVSSQIGLRLDQMTPADRQLAQIDKAEAERGRQSQVNDAASTVKESQKEVTKAQNEVRKAQKKFDNATTAEKKRQARQELTDAKSNLAQTQKNLEDALKQQSETIRQVSLERKRERLQDLAVQQREELEKSVAAEQKRANGMFDALRTALKNKNWTAVQNIFNQIVDLVGIKNLGKAAADNYTEGLIEGLKTGAKEAARAVANQQKQVDIARQQEAIAGPLVSGFRERNQGKNDPIVPGPNAVSGLRFLINNGLIDQQLALQILGMMSRDKAKSALSLFLREFASTMSFDDDKEYADIVKKKLGPKDALARMLRHFTPQDEVMKAFSLVVKNMQMFAGGGMVHGSEGRGIPVIAHAGEWILNKVQQNRLAEMLGSSKEKVQGWLFKGLAAWSRSEHHRNILNKQQLEGTAPHQKDRQWIFMPALNKFFGLLSNLGKSKFGSGKDEIGKIVDAFKHSLHFAAGGTVGGTSGAVPIIAHAGEWVLNKAQQSKLAVRLGESTEQAKMWLFGTKMPPGQARMTLDGRKTKSTTKYKTYSYRNFNLVPQEDITSTDEKGNPVIVWFIEMDDGAFGQVSQRDARKIIASNGTFIPGYVKRSTHGFSNPLQRIKNRVGGSRGSHGSEYSLGGVVQKFMNGGVVLPRHTMHNAFTNLQSFAEGGTVLQQDGFGSGASPTVQKSIEQNFNVTTQGETDWNYVLRLGAQHAQGSYT